MINAKSISEVLAFWIRPLI